MNQISIKLKKEARTAYTYAAGTTVVSHTFQANGFARFIVVNLPNFTTAATAVLTVLNSDGDTLYTSSAITKNSTTNIIIADGYIPLTGETTFTLTLNDVAGGAHTAYITPYVR